MEVFLIILLIVVGAFFFVGLLVACLMDNGTGSSNGFYTRNNRNRSYNSQYDEEREDTFVHLSRNNGHFDYDDGAWWKNYVNNNQHHFRPRFKRPLKGDFTSEPICPLIYLAIFGLIMCHGVSVYKEKECLWSSQTHFLPQTYEDAEEYKNSLSLCRRGGEIKTYNYGKQSIKQDVPFQHTVNAEYL